LLVAGPSGLSEVHATGSFNWLRKGVYVNEHKDCTSMPRLYFSFPEESTVSLIALCVVYTSFHGAACNVYAKYILLYFLYIYFVAESVLSLYGLRFIEN
jgi:hypothetical protein